MKKLILTSLCIFALGMTTFATTTAYVKGKGGATTSGGTTRVCPDPSTALCATITSLSSDQFQVGSIVYVQIVETAETRTLRIKEVDYPIENNQSINGSQISFEEVKQ